MQSISEPIGMNTTVPIAEAAHTLVQDTESSVPAKVGERSPPTFAVYGGSCESHPPLLRCLADQCSHCPCCSRSTSSGWCVVTRVAMETELFITRLKDAGVALARPMVYKLYISVRAMACVQYCTLYSISFLASSVSDPPAAGEHNLACQRWAPIR